MRKNYANDFGEVESDRVCSYNSFLIALSNVSGEEERENVTAQEPARSV